VDDIKMIEHGGGGERYAAMIDSQPEKMLAERTSSVDAVSGATVSSINLEKAVEDALNKARK
jgi:major membrane immunogen (membrane-anchored lipoprotein)